MKFSELKKTLPLIFTFLHFYSNAQEQYLVDKIAIEVINSSREFAFTNKEDTYYYSETNSEHRSSWQGFNVFGREYLEDYLFQLDESLLKRNFVKKTLVLPYQLKRIYNNGVEETLTLLDSFPVVIVDIKLPKTQKVSFFPLVSDFKKKSDFIISASNNVLLIVRKNHTERTQKQNYPVYLGIASNKKFNLLDEQSFSNNYSPAGCKFLENNIRIAIGVGDTPEHTVRMLNYVLKNSEILIQKRKDRMEKVLQDTFVETENEEFNRALMWAKLSMDALIMNQVTKGIFAGLPWFNNYWGRDSFISLPGATLVTGNFSEARKILTSFAVFQEQDESSINYGRIPNIITTTHKSYNTADGTPRFVIAAYEYYKYSGDKNFVEEIFPYLKIAIEGSLKYRTDKFYFLTHDDADTWMDAVGPDGPWTPRGNRANDVQALWYEQLICSAEFAKVLNKHQLAEEWLKISDSLKNNFTRYFLDSSKGFIFDHLNADDSPDLKDRPNQIFCTNLLNDHLRTKILANVIRNLTFEYGVASLSQEDEQFHPYHQNPPFYVKDAAYHQGTVWTWLSGEVISELCYFDCKEKAYTLTKNLVHQILNHGAVGTISELLDAHPKSQNEEPALSGTFSQAWSLAEFIRNFYQDYLNIQFDFSNERRIHLHPRIPEPLGNVRAKIKFGDEYFTIIYSNKNLPLIEIADVNIYSPISLTVELNSNGKEFSCSNTIVNSSYIKVSLIDTMDIICDCKPEISKPIVKVSERELYFRDILMNTPFAVPRISADYAVLKPPTYKLLNNKEIKKVNIHAVNLIDVNDPAYDDTGYTGYKYPLNPNFVDGILDVLNFKVDYDSENVYFNFKFRKLTNPGWHPEYGFQLTYIAIAIDEDGKVESGRREIGMNSKYVLAEDEAFEKIIYVGGGLRIENEKGDIIALYVPVDSDVNNPLGDISNSIVSFSLPVEIIEKPERNWRFIVLVGAQDDHGGAGLGDFRNVDSIESEWSGGGKTNPNLPNVYDILKTF